MTLDSVLRQATDLLRDGASARQPAFRTLALASVDADGAPDVRTVILRGFDPDSRTLSVHTDARSAKVAQLRVRPRVALHAWDAAGRLQVRLFGRATLHAADATARAAWAALPALGRHLYRIRQEPGTTVADPSAVSFDDATDTAGFETFVVVEVAYHRLETLRLADHGQIRARFDWTEGGLAAAWLVP
jgi:hypothetical protein